MQEQLEALTLAPYDLHRGNLNKEVPPSLCLAKKRKKFLQKYGMKRGKMSLICKINGEFVFEMEEHCFMRYQMRGSALFISPQTEL